MSNKPKQGTFCWNELMTQDVAGAKAFYTGLLGWESQELPMGDGMTYTIFKTADQDVAGMLQTPAGQEDMIPPHWLSYIAVDDIDSMTNKAESLGATIKVPVQTVEGMGCFSVMMDPTGAHFAFWEAM